MTHIYKILSRSEWVVALDQGRFEGSEVDRRDGYIHLSTAAQAGETARLHFAGQDGLVLLKLDGSDLGQALKWESSRGGQLFPHLYAALDLAHVILACPLPLNPQGWPDPGPLEA